jgi:hypothetical protein
LTDTAGSLKVLNTMPGWTRSLIRHETTASQLRLRTLARPPSTTPSLAESSG